MSELSIRYVRLHDIEPDPANAKEHDLEALVDAFQQYGFRDPMLYDDRTGRLAAGHGRTEALLEMHDRGYTRPRHILQDQHGEWLVPVVGGGASEDDMEAKGFLLMANRAQDLAGYNQSATLALLDDLNAGAPDLFATLRYSSDELDDLMRRGGEVLEPDHVDDAVPDGPGRAEAPPPIGQDEDTPLEDLEDEPANDRPSMLRCEACGHMNPTSV